jgi:hypothetical protein
MPAECPLCEAAHLTPWHYEDEECWIADCEVCGVPMVVWKHHHPVPPPAVKERMIAELKRVADSLMGTDHYRIDDVMRQIPDHFHAHARSRSNPFGRLLGEMR